MNKKPKEIAIMMDQNYPFGKSYASDDFSHKVIVKRTIDCSNCDRQQLLARCYYFRRLNQTNLVRLQRMTEEKDHLQLFYQYVPICMETWIQNISQKFIDGFCRQLIELGNYLAKCFIKTRISMKCVGMDQNYSPKYFLDLNFVVDQTLDKARLRVSYQQQVLDLFKPYLQRKIASSHSNGIKENSDTYKNQQIHSNKKYQNPETSLSNIARYGEQNGMNLTLSAIRLMNKTFAQNSQSTHGKINSVNYPPEMTGSHDQNIKQSVISSSSSIKIGQLGRRIDSIKSNLKKIYSSEQIILQEQHQSVQKRKNIITFNFGETQQIISPKLSKPLNSAAFYKGILHDLTQDEIMFQKIESNISKRLHGQSLKKNQTLKVKEYQQMTQSKHGYFKDFFNVLEDRPKLPTPDQKMITLVSSPEQQRAAKQQVQNSLQNRVKKAITKSKTLLSKLKGDG